MNDLAKITAAAVEMNNNGVATPLFERGRSPSGASVSSGSSRSDESSEEGEAAEGGEKGEVEDKVGVEGCFDGKISGLGSHTRRARSRRTFVDGQWLRGLRFALE